MSQQKKIAKAVKYSHSSENLILINTFIYRNQEMNYQRIHDNIIERAKTRVLEGYKETHHIVPRCLGGTDDKTNLVDLTAKEHFLIHRLLTKIHKNEKIKHAFAMMSVTRTNPNKYMFVDYCISSRTYEQAKIVLSERRKGKKLSNSTKKKISDKLKGRVFSESTIEKMKKPKSESHRKNISLSKTGENNPAYGVPIRLGAVLSEETKQLISEKTKEATEYPPCPHCGVVTNKGNALRWHYDKCKERK